MQPAETAAFTGRVAGMIAYEAAEGVLLNAAGGAIKAGKLPKLLANLGNMPGVDPAKLNKLAKAAADKALPLLEGLVKRDADDAFRASRGSLNSFSRASEFGIQSYSKLRKLTKGTELQAHHLIEKRFAEKLGLKASQMESIALTKAEHQIFTNLWRDAIGHRGDKQLITTANATRQQIMDAARKVYKGHPEILKALGL